MPYGTVARFLPAKGFGFIQAQRGPDVFFHVTALGACESQPRIEPGQAVKYELASEAEQQSAGRRRPTAEDAAQPAGEPQPRAKLVELIDQIPAAVLNSAANEPQAARHPRARRKKPTWRR